MFTNIISTLQCYLPWCTGKHNVEMENLAFMHILLAWSIVWVSFSYILQTTGVAFTKFSSYIFQYGTRAILGQHSSTIYVLCHKKHLSYKKQNATRNL